jgi:hypothetical protein
MNILNICWATVVTWVKECFVMHYIGNYKLAPKANLDGIKTFKKMHVNIYILAIIFRV